mgnify:FL=1
MVTNTTVAPLYLDKVVAAIKDGGFDVTVESVILPDGEQYKDMVQLFNLIHMLVFYSYGMPEINFAYNIIAGNTNEGV